MGVPVASIVMRWRTPSPDSGVEALTSSTEAAKDPSLSGGTPALLNMQLRRVTSDNVYRALVEDVALDCESRVIGKIEYVPDDAA